MLRQTKSDRKRFTCVFILQGLQVIVDRQVHLEATVKTQNQGYVGILVIGAQMEIQVSDSVTFNFSC